MLKMILVDDEAITRQGIRDSMNWSLMDIEVVGEASNGIEGMLLVHEVDPDIIICDIRMPKLDGISLINEIQLSHPDAQVLFLSGYSDKEYLKNAIKLEAVDYIFKPFQLHELVAAVEKAKNNCLRRRATRLKQNADIALELLHLDPGTEGRPEYQDLPLRLDATLVTVVLRLNEARPLDASPTGAGFDLNAAVLHHYAAFRAEANRIFNGKCVISCLGPGYVLHANVEPDFALRAATSARLHPFFALLGSPESISVGVGAPVPDAAELADSYRKAHMAASAAFLLGYGHTVFYRSLSNEPFVPRPELARRFQEALDLRDLAEATRCLRDYTEYMQGCRPQDISQIKDALAALAFQLNKRMADLPGVHSEAVSITELVHYSESLQKIREYLTERLYDYFRSMTDLDNKGRLLLEAEQYVLQNAGRELSVRQVAQKLYITPNYLSYLYKKKNGVSFNQFILNARLNQAKKLITETDLRLGEISERLGYTNPNYFTRIFTKYCGVTPREYRSRYGHSAEEEKE